MIGPILRLTLCENLGQLDAKLARIAASILSRQDVGENATLWPWQPFSMRFMRLSAARQWLSEGPKDTPTPLGACRVASECHQPVPITVIQPPGRDSQLAFCTPHRLTVLLLTAPRPRQPLPRPPSPSPRLTLYLRGYRSLGIAHAARSLQDGRDAG